jgi:hypothetical protein
MAPAEGGVSKGFMWSGYSVLELKEVLFDGLMGE